MKTCIPCKYKLKESWNSNIHFEQSRLKDKEDYQGERRTLCNDKGVNSTRYK